MSIVPTDLRIHPSNPHSIVTLFLIVYGYNTLMLCIIIVTNSLIQLRFPILRMLVKKIICGILFCCTI